MEQIEDEKELLQTSCFTHKQYWLFQYKNDTFLGGASTTGDLYFVYAL